jgi:hypothetical protein
MCWTQKFSFSRDPVILDLKLQLALIIKKNNSIEMKNLNLRNSKKIKPETYQWLLLCLI